VYIPRFEENLPDAIPPSPPVLVPNLLEEVSIRRHAVQLDLVKPHRMVPSVDAYFEEPLLLG
jgi:hypothetical protein